MDARTKGDFFSSPKTAAVRVILSLINSLSFLKIATIKHSARIVTLETCGQCDEETRPDQQKDKALKMNRQSFKDEYILRPPAKSNPKDL